MSDVFDESSGTSVLQGRTEDIMLEDAMKDSKKFETGLVGRCFVWFSPAGHVERQGIVRARVTDELWLVQYFEWFSGSLGTLQIVPLQIMISGPTGERQAGSWMFFEDDVHLRSWMKYSYPGARDQESGVAGLAGGLNVTY